MARLQFGTVWTWRRFLSPAAALGWSSGMGREKLLARGVPVAYGHGYGWLALGVGGLW